MEGIGPMARARWPVCAAQQPPPLRSGHEHSGGGPSGRHHFRPHRWGQDVPPPPPPQPRPRPPPLLASPRQALSPAHPPIPPPPAQLVVQHPPQPLAPQIPAARLQQRAPPLRPPLHPALAVPAAATRLIAPRPHVAPGGRDARIASRDARGRGAGVAADEHPPLIVEGKRAGAASRRRQNARNPRGGISAARWLRLGKQPRDADALF